VLVEEDSMNTKRSLILIYISINMYKFLSSLHLIFLYYENLLFIIKERPSHGFFLEEDLSAHNISICI